VTEQTPDVDWAEVERRGRRRNLLRFVIVPAFFGATVLLTGRYALWENTAAWMGLAGFLVLVLGAAAASIASPRLRARAAESFRIHYALRQRIDPGPELREKTDVYARGMAVTGWLGWAFPLVLVTYFVLARWDRPSLAVPSALVLVAAVVAYILWWRRQAEASRRWVEDPPGPRRRVPPPTWFERGFTGRGLMWVLVSAFLFAVLSSLVLVLVVR
jgi:hypothetical protein